MPRLRRYRPHFELLECRETPAGFPLGIGSVGDDFGNAITNDAAGNVYVTGSFQGTVDFDPGPGFTNLVSAGADDIFVAKYTPVGALSWARRIGGSSLEHGFDIAVDPSGNVYTTGRFDGIVDFDPGPGISNLDSIAQYSIFVSKLDTNGNFVWARAMGGSGAEAGRGIAVDIAGNVYTTGVFNGTADFDPGAGVYNLTPVGGYDAFVSKLDSAGNFVWAKSIGGSIDDSGRSIAVDVLGNVCVTGSFQTTADFDPGPGNFLLTATQFEDIFVSKLDSSGNFLWADRIGGLSSDGGEAIALDGIGNIYATGHFQGTVDFDPGPGTFLLNTFSTQEVFVCKLDPGGNLVWAIQTQGGPSSNAFGITLDILGNVIVGGFFTGGAQNFGSFTLSSVGGRDIFVFQLNSAGSFVWVGGMGGSNDDQSYGVAVDSAGHIYTTGFFNDTADFDPGAGIANLMSAGNSDIFLSKLGPDAVITGSGGSTNVAEGGPTDTYTIVLDWPPTANVLVTLNPDSQVTVSAPTLTFTPANWNALQTVTVTAVDDSVAEGNHTGSIVHTASSGDARYNGLAMPNVTAIITDNDVAGVTIVQSGSSTDVAEGGAGDSYTAVLSSQPTANVTVAVNALSQVTASPTTLTFTPTSWNVAQTVSVAAIDDLIAEGMHNGTVAHASGSLDPNYNGLVVNVTANITDNDVAGVVLTPSGGSTDVAEGGASDTYTATLSSQPTANVVVTVNPGAELTVAPIRLTFTSANWGVAQTVTVAAIDDGVSQATRNVNITHAASSADLFYNGVAVAPLAVNITDNDQPDVTFTLTNGGITVLEGTGQSYTAVLKTQPAADVVLTMYPDSQVSVAPATLTFTPGNWNTPQPVVVAAIDDGGIEGPHLGIVDHTAASADPTYNGLSLVSVTANIVDNDGGDTILGTGGKDQIAIAFAPGKILVNLNGKTSILPDTIGQLLVYAGAGNDAIQVTSPTVPVVVDGGLGTDQVFVSGQTGGNAFVLDSSSVKANGIDVSVWDVEGLIVNGKIGNDTFVIQNVPCFAVELKADRGSDQIVAGNRPNTWQIAAADGGYLDATIKLSGIENWTGGPAADTFAFSTGKALTGKIDGGGGADVLDWSASTTAITVNLQAMTATGTKGIQNITKLIGGKGTTDKLIGPNLASSWNLTPAGGSVNSIVFLGIENLSGGSLDDTFQFADGAGIKGKIDGGGGVDSLDYTALTGPVLVNLQTKTASGAAGFVSGFSNVEQFHAGTGLGDTLIGANKGNVWSLTAQGAGDVSGTSFTNFEHFTGGTAADAFTLMAGGDWLGILNGAVGTDSLTSAPGGYYTSTGAGAGTLNGRKFLGVEVRR